MRMPRASKAALLLIAFASIGTKTALAGGSLSCTPTYKRSYPGTRCIVASGASAGYAKGRLSNVSDTAIGIECPVLYSGLHTNTVFPQTVWVVDQHPSEAVTCYLRKLSSTSAGISGMWVQASSQGSSAVPQKLAFASINPLLSSYLNVDCKLPPAFSGQRSAIVAYQLTETCY